jgi:hypothetical protein
MHALIKILLKKTTPQYKRPKALKTRGFQGFWTFILRGLFKIKKAIQVKYLDSLKFVQQKNSSLYYGKIPKFI